MYMQSRVSQQIPLVVNIVEDCVKFSATFFQKKLLMIFWSTNRETHYVMLKVMIAPLLSIMCMLSVEIVFRREVVCFSAI